MHWFRVGGAKIHLSSPDRLQYDADAGRVEAMFQITAHLETERFAHRIPLGCFLEEEDDEFALDVTSEGAAVLAVVTQDRPRPVSDLWIYTVLWPDICENIGQTVRSMLLEAWSKQFQEGEREAS